MRAWRPPVPSSFGASPLGIPRRSRFGKYKVSENFYQKAQKTARGEFPYRVRLYDASSRETSTLQLHTARALSVRPPPPARPDRTFSTSRAESRPSFFFSCVWRTSGLGLARSAMTTTTATCACRHRASESARSGQPALCSRSIERRSAPAPARPLPSPPRASRAHPLRYAGLLAASPSPSPRGLRGESRRP